MSMSLLLALRAKSFVENLLKKNWSCQHPFRIGTPYPEKCLEIMEHSPETPQGNNSKSDRILVCVNTDSKLFPSRFIELWDDMEWSDLTGQITKAMKIKESFYNRYEFETDIGAGYVENTQQLKLVLKYKQTIKSICFHIPSIYEPA